MPDKRKLQAGGKRHGAAESSFTLVHKEYSNFSYLKISGAVQGLEFLEGPKRKSFEQQVNEALERLSLLILDLSELEKIFPPSNECFFQSVTRLAKGCNEMVVISGQGPMLEDLKKEFFWLKPEHYQPDLQQGLKFLLEQINKKSP